MVAKDKLKQVQVLERVRKILFLLASRRDPYTMHEIAAATDITARTEELVAMHISQENNRPSLAVRALAHALGATLDNELGSSATLERAEGSSLRIRAAGQNRPMSVG